MKRKGEYWKRHKASFWCTKKCPNYKKIKPSPYAKMVTVKYDLESGVLYFLKNNY